MKKIIKIVLIVAAVLGVGAVIFYFVAPEMFMNMLDTLSYYINKPLPLVGISVLTLSLVALKIFAGTSFGKKALNEVKEEAKTFKEEAEKYKEAYEEEKELAKEQVKELKADYENKLQIANSQFDYFEKNMIKILEQIPNAKVQEEIKTFNSNYKQHKEEIGLVVNDGYELVNAKLEELDGIIHEAKQKLNNKTEEE